MKAVILAGGLGTRLSEETGIRPKPMVEIGGKPILWHILKIYSFYGINEFIICLGYKGYMIKEYFSNYSRYNGNITVDIRNNTVEYHNKIREPWKINLIDTGEKTSTGGRLARVKEYLSDEPFCMTYGDGLGNVDIKKLIEFHFENNKLATLTAVQPPGRYGAIDFKGEKIINFQEKRDESSWINGGFFVLNPEVIDLISGDDCMWEDKPLKFLASTHQLNAFKHFGFWHPMDTLKDRITLQNMCEENNAPWKIWE